MVTQKHRFRIQTEEDSPCFYLIAWRIQHSRYANKVAKWILRTPRASWTLAAITKRITMKGDIVDQILGWIALGAFISMFLSLIIAVIDVWYIQPLRKKWLVFLLIFLWNNSYFFFFLCIYGIQKVKWAHHTTIKN